MAERFSCNWGLCVSVRVYCYLAVLYNIAVFAANFLLYVIERSSWQKDANEVWIRWQWVDLCISCISLLAAMLLYTALVTSKHRILLVFLIWTVICIILSIIVVGFGFRELSRGPILARCLGIVVSAFFANAVFSHYLKLKNAETAASRASSRRQSYTLEPISSDYSSSDLCNGGFHTDEEMIEIDAPCTNVRTVRLWYENTKM
ncbi:uncharacterized protein LOC114525571 [Dendronephthya gigantea]|uniref:uncharacterized protein LOC114525571 n=1 Tax=Dendronephthya gigantea TaxID=151771 RepID=UPI00106C134A|nr:uncharacterized protein LOC114525571 [Dendronephthya gigantea]